jgi:hypothetical protein
MNAVSLRLGRIALLTCLFGSILGTSPVHAEVFCIESAAALNAQLPTINSAARLGTAIDLRFRSGYYDLSTVNTGGSVAIHLERNGLESPLRVHRISGGWNEGCTQQAALQTAETSSVLDARGQRPLLRFRHRRGPLASGMNWTVQLRVEQLQFADAQGSCLDVSRETSGSLQLVPLDVTIERSRFELCGAMTFAATPMSVATEGNVTLRNSVFVANRGGAAAFSLNASNGILAVYNNTLRFNQSAADSFSAMAALSAQTIYFQNNLIADSAYGGSARDVYLQAGSAFVRSNRMTGAIFQFNPSDVLITSGNTTDAPGFLNAQSPRLATNSAMRDRGLVTVPAPGYGPLDWEGQLRLRGTAPEIGAFELPPTAEQEIVFSNGFEAP